MTRASLRLVIPAVLLVACSERPTGPPDQGSLASQGSASALKGGSTAELASALGSQSG